MTATRPIGEFVLDVEMLRTHIMIQKAAKEERLLAWELENADLLAHLKESIAELEVAESALRGKGIVLYQATGNKHPYPGVEVKVLVGIEYSEADALAWAKEHEIALRLDKVAFEKLAHATPIPFVTYFERPRCDLARDLGAALAKEAAQKDA